MSVRNKIRQEVLKLRSARLQATGGNGQDARAQMPRFGRQFVDRIQQQVQGQEQPAQIVSASTRMPIGETFQPKTPILQIFMNGSRPVRETASRLIAATNQGPDLQPQEEAPPLRVCAVCGGENAVGANFCLNCGANLSEKPRSQYAVGNSRGIGVEL